MDTEQNLSGEEIDSPQTEKVDPRFTSHLENVKLPFADRPETIEAEKMPDVTLPKTLKGVHAAIKTAREEANPKIRVHKISALTKQLHVLSQGTPVPPLTSKSAKALNGSQNDAAEEVQILMLCRTYPVIKKFLDRGTDALEKAKATIESQAAELDALKTPKK